MPRAVLVAARIAYGIDVEFVALGRPRVGDEAGEQFAQRRRTLGFIAVDSREQSQPDRPPATRRAAQGPACQPEALPAVPKLTHRRLAQGRTPPPGAFPQRGEENVGTV